MPKPTTPLPLPTCQRSSILWLQIITRLLIDTFNIVYNVSHWFHGMELFFWSKNKIRGIISITQRRNTSLMKYQYMDLMDPFKVTKPWELKKIMQRTSELYSHTSQFIWIFNEYVCVCVWFQGLVPPPPIIPSYKLLFTTSACFWSVSNKIIKYRWNAIHSYQFK